MEAVVLVVAVAVAGVAGGSVVEGGRGEAAVDWVTVSFVDRNHLKTRVFRHERTKKICLSYH